MTQLGDMVTKIRSKNAGPFWVTVDVFCGSPDVFARLRGGLTTEIVAEVYRVEAASMKRFDIAELDVIKFSFPRPVVQGSASDRDQHGAQYAVLLAEMELA